MNNQLIEVRSNLLDKELELKRLEEQLKEQDLYKKISLLKGEIEKIKKLEEEQEKSLIEIMLQENVKELENDLYKIKLINTGRESVEILSLEEIPKEFKRVKTEPNKVAIMKFYKETGAITAGTNIVKNDKYKIDITYKKAL
jgi:hypothetical protein